MQGGGDSAWTRRRLPARRRKAPPESDGPNSPTAACAAARRHKVAVAEAAVNKAWLQAQIWTGQPQVRQTGRTERKGRTGRKGRMGRKGRGRRWKVLGRGRGRGRGGRGRWGGGGLAGAARRRRRRGSRAWCGRCSVRGGAEVGRRRRGKLGRGDGSGGGRWGRVCWCGGGVVAIRVDKAELGVRRLDSMHGGGVRACAGGAPCSARMKRKRGRNDRHTWTTWARDHGAGLKPGSGRCATGSTLPLHAMC